MTTAKQREPCSTTDKLLFLRLRDSLIDPRHSTMKNSLNSDLSNQNQSESDLVTGIKNKYTNHTVGQRRQYKTESAS